MWGNARGWAISGLIVLAMIGFVAYVQWSAHTITPRTQFSRDPSRNVPISLGVAPTLVAPAMTEPTDAGEIYRRTLEEMNKSPQTYSEFSRTGTPADMEDIPAIQLARQATPCITANIFRRNASQIVNLENRKPALAALDLLGKCMIRAGMLIEKDRPAEAMDLYEATFSLGYKLFDERLTYAEMETGLNLMAAGAKSIELLAQSSGNAQRAESARRFDAARKTLMNDQLLPMLKVLSSVDQPTLEEHFGDVLYFARFAKERVWRIEAIFALARYRFNAARIGDQTTAMQTLRELAEEDDDPIVKLAAAAGRDMTIEQYRMLR